MRVGGFDGDVSSSDDRDSEDAAQEAIVGLHGVFGYAFELVCVFCCWFWKRKDQKGPQISLLF